MHSDYNEFDKRNARKILIAILGLTESQSDGMRLSSLAYAAACVIKEQRKRLFPAYAAILAQRSVGTLVNVKTGELTPYDGPTVARVKRHHGDDPMNDPEIEIRLAEIDETA